MNDYLDEDIKFDEGMNVKEDDSIKSSSSSSSFDYVENLIDSPTNIFDNKNSNPSSIKTLIKSNVKKVMNSFKISKPDITPLSEQNIAISFSEIDNNLNKITDSFTSSELNEIVANNETTNAVVSEPNILPTETMIVANHDVNSDQNVEVSETINAHVSESTEPKIESMSLQTCALILSQDSNISDTINDHKLESIEVTSETMESEEEEEKNDKPETKVNKKKRNKKKKK